MYKNHKKTACKMCGRLFDVANIKRHEESCARKLTVQEKIVYRVDHDDLFCKFCNKECRNKNSLTQHELRCRNNPDRKDVDKLSVYITNNRKGKTKENCDEVRRQSEKLRQRYCNGYKSGGGWAYTYCGFTHLHHDHNVDEINKWILYTRSLAVEIDPYEKSFQNNGYVVVKRGQIVVGNTVKPLYEHNYIANILLNGKLSPTNVVHHINENKQDNSYSNLMVFETASDHKRYHTSKYAYLIYNEETHLFTCKNIRE